MHWMKNFVSQFASTIYGLLLRTSSAKVLFQSRGAAAWSLPLSSGLGYCFVKISRLLQLNRVLRSAAQLIGPILDFYLCLGLYACQPVLAHYLAKLFLLLFLSFCHQSGLLVNTKHHVMVHIGSGMHHALSCYLVKSDLSI